MPVAERIIPDPIPSEVGEPKIRTTAGRAFAAAFARPSLAGLGGEGGVGRGGGREGEGGKG